MRKILFLFLASLLFIAATAKQRNEATITVLSNSKTFYLVDSDNNRLAQFPIDDEVMIKRKGK